MCPGIILVSAILVVQFGGLRLGSVLVGSVLAPFWPHFGDSSVLPPSW